jgi:hypothetical protein
MTEAELPPPFLTVAHGRVRTQRGKIPECISLTNGAGGPHFLPWSFFLEKLSQLDVLTGNLGLEACSAPEMFKYKFKDIRL